MGVGITCYVGYTKTIRFSLSFAKNKIAEINLITAKKSSINMKLKKILSMKHALYPLKVYTTNLSLRLRRNKFFLKKALYKL